MSKEEFIDDDYYEMNREQRQPTPEDSDTDDTVDIGSITEHEVLTEEDQEKLNKAAKQFQERQAKAKAAEAQAQTTHQQATAQMQTPTEYRKIDWNDKEQVKRKLTEWEEMGISDDPPTAKKVPPPVPPKPDPNAHRAAKNETRQYMDQVYDIGARLNQNVEQMAKYLTPTRSYFITEDDIQRKCKLPEDQAQLVQRYQQLKAQTKATKPQTVPKMDESNFPPLGGNVGKPTATGNVIDELADLFGKAKAHSEGSIHDPEALDITQKLISFLEDPIKEEAKKMEKDKPIIPPIPQQNKHEAFEASVVNTVADMVWGRRMNLPTRDTGTIPKKKIVPDPTESDFDIGKPNATSTPPPASQTKKTPYVDPNIGSNYEDFNEVNAQRMPEDEPNWEFWVPPYEEQLAEEEEKRKQRARAEEARKRKEEENIRKEQQRRQEEIRRREREEERREKEYRKHADETCNKKEFEGEKRFNERYRSPTPEGAYGGRQPRPPPPPPRGWAESKRQRTPSPQPKDNKGEEDNDAKGYRKGQKQHSHNQENEQKWHHQKERMSREEEEYVHQKMDDEQRRHQKEKARFEGHNFQYRRDPPKHFETSTSNEPGTGSLHRTLSFQEVPVPPRKVEEPPKKKPEHGIWQRMEMGTPQQDQLKNKEKLLKNQGAAIGQQEIMLDLFGKIQPRTTGTEESREIQELIQMAKLSL